MCDNLRACVLQSTILLLLPFKNLKENASKRNKTWEKTENDDGISVCV